MDQRFDRKFNVYISRGWQEHAVCVKGSGDGKLKHGAHWPQREPWHTL